MIAFPRLPISSNACLAFCFYSTVTTSSLSTSMTFLCKFSETGLKALSQASGNMDFISSILWYERQAAPVSSCIVRSLWFALTSTMCGISCYQLEGPLIQPKASRPLLYWQLLTEAFDGGVPGKISYLLIFHGLTRWGRWATPLFHSKFCVRKLWTSMGLQCA